MSRNSLNELHQEAELKQGFEIDTDKYKSLNQLRNLVNSMNKTRSQTVDIVDGLPVQCASHKDFSLTSANLSLMDINKSLQKAGTKKLVSTYDQKVDDNICACDVRISECSEVSGIKVDTTYINKSDSLYSDTTNSVCKCDTRTSVGTGYGCTCNTVSTKDTQTTVCSCNTRQTTDYNCSCNTVANLNGTETPACDCNTRTGTTYANSTCDCENRTTYTTTSDVVNTPTTYSCLCESRTSQITFTYTGCSCNSRAEYVYSACYEGCACESRDKNTTAYWTGCVCKDNLAETKTYVAVSLCQTRTNVVSATKKECSCVSRTETKTTVAYADCSGNVNQYVGADCASRTGYASCCLGNVYTSGCDCKSRTSYYTYSYSDCVSLVADSSCSSAC
jgi:hypothetical protein